MYLRFAILLEAYCRGNASHMEMIIKQKEMVDTLTELSKMVKSYALKGRKRFERKKLEQPNFFDWLCTRSLSNSDFILKLTFLGFNLRILSLLDLVCY